MKKLIKFFKDEEGATAIEYALIAARISVVAVAAYTAVGTAITGTMNGVAGDITGAS